MNPNTTVFILVFSLVLNVRFVFSFLPSSESTGERSDFTHGSITEDGIYKAVAEVIIEKVKPGTYHSDSHTDKVKAFFNLDNRSKYEFEKTVHYIVNKVNSAQRLYSSDASRTMSCEQISAGNILLHLLRAKIIQLCRTRSTDWGPIRDMLGEYLFTLQDFYSNTNWVEMSGSKPYTELGVQERLSIKISDAKEAMCTSCNHSKITLHTSTNSCASNLMKNGHLTSGYTSNQHIIKPYNSFPAHAGKCSHGGPSDVYRGFPATGGINKETSDPGLSPHYHLHTEAGRAAVQATADFLVGQDTGLLYQIGLEQTTGLLGLDYRQHCYNCLSPALSVVFVIDDAGSVSGQLQEAFRHSVAIVNQARVSTAPFNYILSTTGNKEHGLFVTTNGEEFKNRLQFLQSSNGGNSLKTTLHATLNAMQQAQPGSCIFSFASTDPIANAKGKDTGLLHDALYLLENKNLHLMQFLQGNNSNSHTAVHKRISNHVTASPTDVHCFVPNANLHKQGKRGKRSNIFEEIALHTSSSVIQTSHSTLGDILGHVLQENMNIQTLGVDSFEMLSLTTHVFHIDPCISLFTVRLEGSTCSNIQLLRPDGSNQSFTGNASKDVIDSRTTILSVQHPLYGAWQVKNSPSSPCHLTVSGSGCIDLDYKIMEDLRGVKYPITSSSPVLGKKYTISVSVKEIPKNVTTNFQITEIYMKKSDGSTLTSLPVSDSSTGTTRTVSGEVILSEPFYVGIKGTMSSETVTREDQKVVTPVGGQIEFVPPFETLVYNEETSVSVRVSNAGTVKQTFKLTAADTARFLIDPTKHVTLNGNQSKSIDFHLRAVPPKTSTKLTVTLEIERANSQIEQNFMVSTVKPPNVIVTSRTENCKKDIMNPNNCSRQQWEADLTVVFTANMTRLYISPISRALVLTYDRDAIDKNKFTATIKGDCCTSKTSIIAVDSAGNTKSSSINFSGENEFGISSYIKKQRDKMAEDSDPPTVWIAVGCVLGAMAGIGASVALIRKYKPFQNKVNSDPPDFPDPIPNQMSNGHSDNSRRSVFTGFGS